MKDRLRLKAVCSMFAVAMVALAPIASDAAGKAVELRVLSSPAQYVSGGDARIEIRVAPGLPRNVQLYLNGRRLQVPLKDHGEYHIQGMISGLVEGENRLDALIKGRAERDSIKLINHPIAGPMFSGPQQHPFVCTTTQSGVGRQPIVESATPPGTRVFDSAGNVVGYS